MRKLAQEFQNLLTLFWELRPICVALLFQLRQDYLHKSLRTRTFSVANVNVGIFFF